MPPRDHARERDAAQEKLVEVLREQGEKSMPAHDLLQAVTSSGIPEMDAREALLSMMSRDTVHLTSNREVRLEEEPA